MNAGSAMKYAAEFRARKEDGLSKFRQFSSVEVKA
jgi:hypothetical protein